jgi:hypothetical protein
MSLYLRRSFKRLSKKFKSSQTLFRSVLGIAVLDANCLSYQLRNGD